MKMKGRGRERNRKEHNKGQGKERRKGRKMNREGRGERVGGVRAECKCSPRRLISHSPFVWAAGAPGNGWVGGRGGLWV